jgi:uncharacterized protein
MQLDLARIHGPRSRVDRRYEASAFLAWHEDFRVVDRVELGMDIAKADSRFELAGRLTAVLELSCSRCLEPLRWPVDATFRLRYQPSSFDVAVEGDRAVDEDDFEVAFYEGDTIDLGQLMREQFYLALPMKPLCRDECRGLCPVCGANRNTTTCACDAAWGDPRLAGLKDLLKKDVQ